MKVNNSDLGQNYIPRSGAKRGIKSDGHRCWQTLHARNFEKRILQEGADGPPFWLRFFSRSAITLKLTGTDYKVKSNFVRSSRNGAVFLNGSRRGSHARTMMAQSFCS